MNLTLLWISSLTVAVIKKKSYTNSSFIGNLFSSLLMFNRSGKKRKRFFCVVYTNLPGFFFIILFHVKLKLYFLYSFNLMHLISKMEPLNNAKLIFHPKTWIIILFSETMSFVLLNNLKLSTHKKKIIFGTFPATIFISLKWITFSYVRSIFYFITVVWYLIRHFHNYENWIWFSSPFRDRQTEHGKRKFTFCFNYYTEICGKYAD